MTALTIADTIAALDSRHRHTPTTFPPHAPCTFCVNQSAAHVNYGVTDPHHCGRCRQHWPCDDATIEAALHHMRAYADMVGSIAAKGAVTLVTTIGESDD